MDVQIAIVLEEEKQRQAEKKRLEEEKQRQAAEENARAWQQVTEQVGQALPEYLRPYLYPLGKNAMGMPDPRFVDDCTIIVDDFAPIVLPLQWQADLRQFVVDQRRFVLVSKPWLSYEATYVFWEHKNPHHAHTLPEALVLAEAEGKEYSRLVEQLKMEISEREMASKEREKEAEIEYVPAAEQNDITAALVQLVRDVVREVMQEMAAD